MAHVTSAPLSLELTWARQRAQDVVPALSDAAFSNDPSDVAAWLDGAAEAALRHDFFLPRDDSPQTLYLWMNDFEFNLDRWFLAPFASGPERPSQSPFDWRDALVGDDIGDGLRVAHLTLTGMEFVRPWFDHSGDPAVQSTAAEIVLMAAFDLIAQSLPRTKRVPFRIAMSSGEQWRVCTWASALAAAQVHTWRSGEA